MKNSSTIIRKSLTRIVRLMGEADSSMSAYEHQTNTTDDVEDGRPRRTRDARPRRLEAGGGRRPARRPAEDLPRGGSRRGGAGRAGPRRRRRGGAPGQTPRRGERAPQRRPPALGREPPAG